MAKEYFEKLTKLFKDTQLSKEIGSKRINGSDFEIKHFFSGTAVYWKGRICITLTPAGFAIKLPEKSRKRLMDGKEAKEVRYFSKGHVKKEYVILPKRILDDKKLLVGLIEESFGYVSV